MLKSVFQRIARAVSIEDPETGEIVTRQDELGREIPDPTPIAPPVGYVRQEPLHMLIQRMVRSEHMKQAAIAAGKETFEESEDFNVGDDYDPTSPWENEADTDLGELLQAGQAEIDRKSTSEQPAPPAPPPGPAGPSPAPSSTPAPKSA